MMRLLSMAALALGVALAPLAPDAAAETPTLRIGLQAAGTVNWLTDAIRTGGHDAAAGFRLEELELAARDATSIAFQAGEVDVIVADWVWAMHERARGKDIRFLPYSRALGALMTMPGLGVDDLCDLKGRPVGVVGGELDKSWLVFQALAQRDCGFALAAETSAVFGAPPLISKQLTSGAVDAASTFWHFAARLEAEGAVRVLDVTEALGRLGVEPAPPLVGFVWDAGRTDPAMAARLERAVAAAGRVLAADDAEWDRLRPRMNATTDAAFRALRDAYRAGVVAEGWTAADTEAAGRLHAALIAAGGPAFAADAGVFDPAAFPR